MQGTKPIPFSHDVIKELVNTYETPLYLYDEKGICDNIRELYAAFSWHAAFKNFFAVKATPTPKILSMLYKNGMNMDCSSYSELVLMEKLGIQGKQIMFTSNNTPFKDLQKALELGAIINLDDISLLDFLLAHFSHALPDTLCFRYNPGPLKQGNVIIGNPEEAKYGLTREQIFEAYTRSKEQGIRHFGLHTMVASNELNPDYFVETAAMLFTLIVEIREKTGVCIEFVNLGGGIGIPYTPEERRVDYTHISEGIKNAYHSILKASGCDDIHIFMENGRVITGPYGYLISKVLHKKNIYKQYVGLDACMSNLMRPGMYGAYHHITVLEKEQLPHDHVYDVTGGLCENNDKFAINRTLPTIERDDIVIIHDAGAHGHAMGFNYNGKLRSAEILVHSDGSTELIRRAETVDDYLATAIF